MPGQIVTSEEISFSLRPMHGRGPTTTSFQVELQPRKPGPASGPSFLMAPSSNGPVPRTDPPHRRGTIPDLGKSRYEAISSDQPHPQCHRSRVELWRAPSQRVQATSRFHIVF